MKNTVVIATIRPWNIAQYRAWNPPRGYRKVLITRKEDLTPERLAKLNPRYVFFPHWSWIIPPTIYERFECVVLHMTDLPFGRGGSPMQNLIARGIYKTKVSAIRVSDGVDTGPVYLKYPLDLSEGSAEEMFHVFSNVAFSMITEILKKNPTPRPQKGRVVTFARRRPEESRLPSGLTVRQTYDFIRMLDAEGYPPAFLEEGEMRIEFRNARLYKGRLTAETCFVDLAPKSHGKKEH